MRPITADRTRVGGGQSPGSVVGGAGDVRSVLPAASRERARRASCRRRRCRASRAPGPCRRRRPRRAARPAARRPRTPAEIAGDGVGDGWRRRVAGREVHHRPLQLIVGGDRVERRRSPCSRRSPAPGSSARPSHRCCWRWPRSPWRRSSTWRAWWSSRRRSPGCPAGDGGGRGAAGAVDRAARLRGRRGVAVVVADRPQDQEPGDHGHEGEHDRQRGSDRRRRSHRGAASGVHLARVRRPRAPRVHRCSCVCASSWNADRRSTRPQPDGSHHPGTRIPRSHRRAGSMVAGSWTSPRSSSARTARS